MYLSRGVRVGVYSPWISHLLFADDCIVFSEASQGGAGRLMEVLNRYNQGSGQLVNKEKSAAFFSKNCSQDTKTEVCQELDIHKEALAERYLGLPTESGRSLSGLFEFLPAQVRRREALQHGLIKRVVDGNTTEIWRDRWIANHFDGRPITPQEDQVITTVSELLNANGDWNIETVRGCFLKIDAEAILRLPVGQGDHDVWAWDMEKSGIYSVKTAYKLLYKIKVEDQDCGDPEESIQHALIGCSVAKRFWHQVRLGTGVKVPGLNPETWATDIISGICSERDIAIILCSMRALWMMRNKRRHGEQPMNDHQAVTWARDTAHDLW
ncbi:unnamed protein product [Miscanthus lutarioriparius]|uniref:Reverse transcriptase domain-containing protein n=1 Tax=Miscanthus lutarioriparius TaxID=422564 RepID=A0A811NXF4_9POAL|nr:unnamed protein product [Miscanthus lutarioriparius]